MHLTVATASSLVLQRATQRGDYFKPAQTNSHRLLGEIYRSRLRYCRLSMQHGTLPWNRCVSNSLLWSLMLMHYKDRTIPRLLVFAACVFLAADNLSAQRSSWQPTPGHAQMPIWPGAVPDAQPITGPEVADYAVDAAGNKHLVGGKPWTYVDRVSRPTMTVYSPQGHNTRTAMVVFPGGGYNVLAIDHEGTEICDWLTSRGITCVLLKYRVPCVKVGPYQDCPTALQDAQRTLGLVRFHAAEWHIDPHRIGVIGFSAGGHMVAALSTHFDKRRYPIIDEADKESCRPDFAIALYPGHLWSAEKKFFGLNPDIRISSRTPPTFLLQAEDDPVDNVNNSLVYFAALKKAGVPAEMHLYAQGGHGFALRSSKFPIRDWPQLVEIWLTTIGMISER